MRREVTLGKEKENGWARGGKRRRTDEHYWRREREGG